MGCCFKVASAKCVLLVKRPIASRCSSQRHHHHGDITARLGQRVCSPNLMRTSQEQPLSQLDMVWCFTSPKFRTSTKHGLSAESRCFLVPGGADLSIISGFKTTHLCYTTIDIMTSSHSCVTAKNTRSSA